MTSSSDKLPRTQAIRCGGAAVMALRLGVGFDGLGVDGLTGMDDRDHQACRLVQLAADMAEARQRGCAVKDVLKRKRVPCAPPDGAETAMLRDHFNAPKVWGAMQAVAGALQARRSLSQDDVAQIIDRIFDTIDQA